MSSTPGVAPSRVRAWLIVATLTCLMLINFADKTSLGLAAKPMLADLHLTLGQYGLISSSFFFLFFLSALAVGFLANRVTTKWILFAIAAIWGAAQLSILAATGLTLLLITRVVLGAAEGPTYPIINHAVYKWLTDRDRSLASAVITSGGTLGVLIGAPVLTYFIVNHGWRSAFVVSGIASFVFCLLWLVIGKEGPLSGAAPAAPGTATGPLEERGLRTSYWRTVGSGTFLASVAAGFAAYWVVANSIAFFPLYLETVLDVSLTNTARITIIVQLFVLVVTYAGQGALTRWLLALGVPSRYARGVLGGACMLIAGAAYALFVFLPGLSAKIAMACLGGLCYVIFAISQTVCAEITPRAQRSGILGTYAALYALSGILAPAITGHLATTLGAVRGLQTSWLIMAGLLVAGGLIAIGFIRPARDAHRLAAHARQVSPRTAPAQPTP